MNPAPPLRGSPLAGLLMGVLLGGGACGLIAADAGSGHRFAIGEHDFLLDGQPRAQWRDSAMCHGRARRN